MKNLWAPWRMEYISDKSKEKSTHCFLCDLKDEKVSSKNLLLYKNEQACIVMNKYPYSNGHLLVAPRAHVHGFDELNNTLAQNIMNLVSLSTTHLRKALNAEGFNVGANIGKCAGAGEEHLHIHVLPRWNGDTNFMPLLSEARVISQHLEETYEKLLPLFSL